ncbi:MAG: CDGSH iron-sulfur domain-containing protein [Gemmatimonadales bacterium]
MRFVNGPRSARQAPLVSATERATTRSTPGIPRLPTKRAAILGRMSQVTITPKSNGPLIIEGPVRIVTPDGRELTPPPRKDGKPAEVVVLCRCGGSATKPFCDGTHKRNGFQDAQITTG